MNFSTCLLFLFAILHVIKAETLVEPDTTLYAALADIFFDSPQYAALIAGSAPSTRRGLKQAVRDSVVQSELRRKSGMRRATSQTAETCVPDTTAATTAVKYAVLSGAQASGTNFVLITASEVTPPGIGACARLCDSTAGCTLGQILADSSGTYCGAFSGTVNGVVAYSGSLEIKGSSCATVKATKTGASAFACCNLYY